MSRPTPATPPPRPPAGEEPALAPGAFDGPHTRPRAFKRCVLAAVEDDRLRFADGSELPFERIQAVAAAMIHEPGDARILIDLLLNWRTHLATKPLKIVRLDSRDGDLRVHLGLTEVGPKIAAAELVRQVAAAAGADVIPESLGRPHGHLPRYDSAEQYHQAALVQHVERG